MDSSIDVIREQLCSMNEDIQIIYADIASHAREIQAIVADYKAAAGSQGACTNALSNTSTSKT